MKFQGTLTIEFLSSSDAPYTTAGFSAEVFESIYGISMYKLNLRIKSIADWNRLERDGGKSDCRIQWGRDVHPGNKLVLSKWRTCRLRNYTALVNRDAVDVKADLVDGMFQMMNRRPRLMFKKKTVKDMAKAIIEGNKLTADVDSFSTTEYNLCQCGMSDYEFIREVLIPRASSEPVLFYTKEGNTVALKQRKKQDKPALEFNPEFIQASDTKIPMREFTTSAKVNATNYGVAAVAFDPLKTQKEPFLKEFMASDTTMPKDPLAAVAPNVLSVAPTDPGKIQNIVVETLGLDVETALRERVRPEFPLNMHRIAVLSYLLPELELGSTAKVVASSSMDVDVQGAGLYMVYAFYNIISATDMITITFLERRGTETK